MNKKPNGQTCTAAADCGSGNCVDGICCSGTCTGTCQSCAVAGSLGSCVNLPAGAQDSTATTPCAGASYCDAAGTCQTTLKPNGFVCTGMGECGSGKCVDGVCCDKTCGEECYTCNLAGGTPGECVGVMTGAKDVCAGANYCDAAHKCTSGKKPNGATCGGDLECASNACVDDTCCESACSSGKCRSCKNATGTCMYAAAGTDVRNDCKGELNCGGKCDGQGACTWAPQGRSCREAGCQADLGLITELGKLRRRGQLRGHDRQAVQRASVASRTPSRRGSVQDRLRDRSRLRDPTSTARWAPTVEPYRSARRRGRRAPRVNAIRNV